MALNAVTSLYCVLGRPVAHSKSPLVHNAMFEDHGINATYLAFEPESIRGAVAAIKSLGIKGASVTIPFKESIMPLLDDIDEEAQQIGAVNTVVNKDGRLFGFNTDSQAAVDPLAPFGIAGKTVGILGAGGAARAVAHGIAKKGGNLVILNRSREKGLALAARYGATFVPLEKALSVAPDILINTTSVGMSPQLEETPFPAEGLKEGMVVMDVVYTPLETRLLKEAGQKNCRTVDGLSMFAAQAAAQFVLWTDLTPDVEKMRQAVLAEENKGVEPDETH